MAGMNFSVGSIDEREMFKDFAKAKGMSLSSWVRSLMVMDIATTDQSQLDKIEQIMKLSRTV